MNTSKQILKLIDHKIYYKRDDTLVNHLKTYFQFDKVNFSGVCHDNSFLIWRYSAWAGLFYTVISGQVFSDNKKTSVNLKTKLNSAGLLFSIFIFFVFFFALFGFQLDTLTIDNILLKLVFASLPIIAIGLGYFHQRKKVIADIKKIIENVC